MKRFFSFLAGFLLLLNLTVPALAFDIPETTEETTEETVSRPANACEEGLTWKYESGTLTISGSGDMDDCSAGAPWDDHAGSITTLVLTGGVTSIGSGAFSGFTGLTDIDFGASLREIGENAFRGCTGLTNVTLPKAFRRFGPSCFEGCANLLEVHCAGGMPSFRTNCLWNGSHITVYCPDDNVWALKYVQELETNFGGRLEVLTESGKDVFTWPDETTAPTQAPTEAATETTQAPTETTQAPTLPPQTQPVVTEPEPTVPSTTQQATVPTEAPAPAADNQREPISGILVGTFILSGTLSLLLIGMLIFRGSRGSGKYRK